MLRIDLGCGTKKQPGFIGVDRYPLGGVDIVADMNRTLPFRDDSVDLLVASHSLEHVETLLATMREVYRICKHGAQLCIVAPYSEQKLNWANPYHRWVFNEHTPRFWTDYPDTPVDAEEYHHPHAYSWGLARTDHSNPGIDIRAARMECFYFPRYAGLPPSEQRRLRQERTDVCDQIMYHLIVWKGVAEGGGRPFDDYLAEFQPYQPEYITELRIQGQEMLLQERAAAKERETQSNLMAELTADLERQKSLLEETRLACQQEHSTLAERMRQELTAANHEATELRTHAVGLTAQITRLHEHCAVQLEAQGRLAAELYETATHNRILRDETVRIERELEFARTELRRESAAAAAAQEEISSLARQNHELKANLESNDLLRAKLGVTRAELETTAALLGIQRQKEEWLSGEVTIAKGEAAAAIQRAAAALHEAERWKARWNAAMRSLRAMAVETRIPEFAHAARVGGLIIGRDRQIQGLPNEFVPMREYCDRHFGTARACIAIGGDLTEVPYREYVIPFELDRLTAVSLAVRPLVPESSGVLGVEIVSARNEILAHVRRELTGIQRDGISEFRLADPLNGLGKNWLLRVFVRDAETPVSVYELVRGALFRGATQSFPLVSFI